MQPLNVYSGKHIGKTYDIHLFAEERNKPKVYIGCLHNAIVIGKDERDEVFEYYKRRGWISKMKEQVKSVGGKIVSGSFSPDLMFNVKFKFSEAETTLPNPPVIPSKLSSRYVLMNKPSDFKPIKEDVKNVKDVKLLDAHPYLRTIKSSEKHVKQQHKEMQNAVALLLKDKYHLSFEKGYESLILGQRVDIVGECKKTGECHFFEVKIGSAIRCIREALGQILEYSLYNNPAPRASKLYIIGPEQSDEKDDAYLKKLRKMYNLPVWYRWYSFLDNTLHDEI